MTSLNSQEGRPAMGQDEIPLRVEVEDILPVIKRFMYSEREVFLRELISNSIDALEKLSQATRVAKECSSSVETLHVAVSLDPVGSTLRVSDNGIGMSRDEVIKYINQIAFSGAREFISRYSDAQNQFIARFGLGFYSSFMVSSRVEIDTLSAIPGNGGCHWAYEGGSQTTIGPTRRTTPGTTVTCSLLPDAREFLSVERVEGIVRRYLDYVPYPIIIEGRQANVVVAPWHLGAAERSDLPRERYWQFYERLNPNDNHPLGWFHIESDYPVQVRALLFIPDRFGDYAGTIRLFANRTFVCDDAHLMLPEWLGFVDGVVDSPDLPVNVARDRFQTDRNVALLRNHLASRTLAFLSDLLLTRRADYIRVWERYGNNLKLGYLDSSMNEQQNVKRQMERLLLFPTTRKPLSSCDEYLERCSDQEKKTLIYSNDPQGQDVHLELLRNCNREVLLLGDRVDPIVIRMLGDSHPNWSFVRVDEAGAVGATTSTSRVDRVDGPNQNWDPLIKLFCQTCGSRVKKVTVESLPSRDVSAVLNVSQSAAREDDLRKALQSKSAAEGVWTLTLNSNSSLVQHLCRISLQERHSNMCRAVVSQVWDTTLLGAGLLQGDDLAVVLRRQREFLALIASQLTTIPSEPSGA